MSENMELNLNEMEEVDGGAARKKVITYVVVKGDTLWGIAKTFGVTVNQLVEWNNIPNPDFIRVGQRLTIYPRIIR